MHFLIAVISRHVSTSNDAIITGCSLQLAQDVHMVHNSLRFVVHLYTVRRIRELQNSNFYEPYGHPVLVTMNIP
jgi:hypothetical protein